MTRNESTILKGLGIIMMFIHHLFYDTTTLFTENVSTWVFSPDLLVRVSAFCKSCVAIFVFISSYGITKSLPEATNIKIYIRKRYIKLIFPFLFVYLIAAIVALISGDWNIYYPGNWISNIYYCVTDALGLANLFGTPTLNGTWWYMSYAIFIIVFVPILNIITQKIGSLGILLLGIFIPVYMGVSDIDPFRWYMMTLILGMLTAKHNIYEKIKRLPTSAQAVLFLLGFCGIFAFECVRWNLGLYWISEACIATLFPIISLAIAQIHLVREIILYIGKHSMNLFLTHSFIYYYYCRSFIYMWKYPLFIFFALLIISVILSVILEQLKKLTGYSSIEKYVLSKIDPPLL